MLNVLIVTSPDDSHSFFVKLALEDKGCNVVIWYTADFPAMQTHSFEVNHDIEWKAKGVDFIINNDKFDVVWYRRPKKPSLSKSLYENDVKNSEKENTMLYHTFWKVIATSAMWINPVKNANDANSKLMQLKVANKCGLKIPATLISNDPAEIISFINKHGDGNVIYKSLYPLYWLENEELRLTYTSRITRDQLPNNEILQSTPGIFQKAIDKAYELRVTYFGERAVAVKINSQTHVKGLMDWRSVPIHQLPIEQYTLPNDIDAKCQRLMRDFGIVFGCFDFIVTPAGEYIFLEINEAGQFLWVEDLNPNIKMLDIFTDFILDGGKYLHKSKNKKVVSMDDYRIKSEYLINEALKIHQNTHVLN